MDQSSPPAVSPFCGRSKVGDAGLYLLPERARQPQLATSLVAPAAAVRVDVRRRWLLAAPAGIFRCAHCRLAAASSNYSPSSESHLVCRACSASPRSSACRSCRIHQPTTSRCCISYLMPARNDRTSPQPLVLFCFGLFWSTRRTNAFCSALPPGYTEVVQESRGDGGAAAGQGSGGRLGPAPHRPGLAGRRRPVGGDQAKIRGLSDKICSAGGRSLAICAPSAQSARRRH